MQVALLSIFCASRSGDLIRIKTLTEQVERGFLEGVLLLQPSGCLPVPWGSAGTIWLEHGKGRRCRASHQCGTGAAAKQCPGVCPSSVRAAWLRWWWDQRIELSGSVPARRRLRRGMAGTRHREKSEMLKGKPYSSHPFELPVLLCSLLSYCRVSAWLGGDFPCRRQDVARLQEGVRWPWSCWAVCRQRGLRSKAPAACPRLPSPSASSSVPPWGMPGALSKPWLSHIGSGMSCAKS